MWARGSAAALCAIVVALPATATAWGATQTPAPAPALRSVPQGAAVRLDTLRSDRRYRDTFMHEFDSLTPENEMKMQALQPQPGEYRFAAADELVRFARANGKAVRGHALIWGQGLPLWVLENGVARKLGIKLPPADPPRLPRRLSKVLGDTVTALSGGWSRGDLLSVMKAHISTVMGHFGDRVLDWDVVNEPLTDSGTRAKNVWQRYIGADYIEQALRTARAMNPRARLFINEYAVEYTGPKLEGLYALARDLRARGVPLDGIGLQAHTHIAGFTDEPALTQTMRRFEALGLKVQITEMDVATTSLLGLTLPQRFDRQALAYGAAARACNAVAACTSFTTWGFTDAVSWLGAGESGLLFDNGYRPKPAFAAVRSSFAPR